MALLRKVLGFFSRKRKTKSKDDASIYPMF